MRCMQMRNKKCIMIDNMIPIISKYLPPVSQFIPLVSSIPPVTLSRRLGIPAWPRYEAPPRRMERAPVEIGFLQFLIWLLTLPATWPFVPLKAIAWIAQSLELQAAGEQDMEKGLEEERISLKMRLEMGEITEGEYRGQVAEIDRKIEEIKGLSK